MCYQEIDLEQNSKEWLEFRQLKLGASEASYVLDINPWESRYSFWHRKFNGGQLFETEAMRRGQLLENRARELVNLEIGKTFVPKVLQSINHPELIASLDGMSDDMILEIKCPSSERSFEDLCEECPDYYYAQIQHQLFVSGKEKAVFCVFWNDSVRFKFVYRDEKFLNEYIPQAIRFIKSLLDIEPPALSDRDWAEVTDEEVCEKADEYKYLSSRIKADQNYLEKLKGEIIEAANGKNSIIGSLKVQNIPRKGIVDYTLIPQLKDIDLSPFRKPATSYWKLY